jgi:hypothetical protein
MKNFPRDQRVRCDLRTPFRITWQRAVTKIIAVAVPLLLEACATGGSTGGLGVYGNFCGPGRPCHSYTSADRVSEFFDTIEPYDYLDCACKEHDLCYARKGRNDPGCDALFDYLVDNRGLTRWCRSVAFDLELYFDYFHYNRTLVGSIVSGAIALPVRLFLTPFDAMEAGQAKAAGELGQPCLYRPELVQPFMKNWSALRPDGDTEFTDWPDQRRQYEYYAVAANKGDCRAWSTVGMHHEDGRGVPRDLGVAMEIYQRGDACGDPYSTYLLGQHTLMGTLSGGEDRALRYFASCADKPGGEDCRVMADMIMYKRQFIEAKYSGDGATRYPQCGALGSGGWLRRWTSPGPKVYR